MPSVFAGAFAGSALTAGGVWNFDSSILPWPSGVRIMAIVARTPSSPTVWSTHGPSTVVSPSSSMPSSAKNALAASRSSTTMSDVVHPLEDVMRSPSVRPAGGSAPQLQSGGLSRSRSTSPTSESRRCGTGRRNSYEPWLRVFTRSTYRSNADFRDKCSITLMCARSGSAEGAGSGGAPRLGDGRGTRAGLCPAFGEPPPLTA